VCTTVTVSMYCMLCAKAKRLTHCVCCLRVVFKRRISTVSRSYRISYILYLIMFFTEPQAHGGRGMSPEWLDVWMTPGAVLPRLLPY